jgi:hypothetical protein
MAETDGYTKAAAGLGSWVIIPFFIGEILLIRLPILMAASQCG